MAKTQQTASYRRGNERPIKVKMYVRFRWILAVVLLPLVVLGLVVLATGITGLLRHDPAYFTETYVERYNTPGSVTRALETALQTDDQALLAELQGLRSPAAFETSPSLIFVMLWEHTDRYITYLYFNMKTYERHPHYIEEVNGRWVVAPPDLYYYMHSGRWQRVFLPLAIFWWVLGFVAIVLVWISRVTKRARARMYGGQEQE
jgi:hypothetical protein